MLCVHGYDLELEECTVCLEAERDDQEERDPDPVEREFRWLDDDECGGC